MIQHLSSACATFGRAVPSISNLALAMLTAAALTAMPSTASAVTINFDDIPGASPVEGTLVPAESRLSNQFQSQGVTFSSRGGFVSVVNLGNQTPSTPNGIAASTSFGLVSYVFPIVVTFVAPDNPSINAVVNSFSISNDRRPHDDGVNTLIALDINGNAIDWEVRYEQSTLLTASAPGIHSVLIIGSGTTAFDKLIFSTPVAVPEPSSLVLAGISAVALGVVSVRHQQASAKSKDNV